MCFICKYQTQIVHTLLILGISHGGYTGSALAQAGNMPTSDKIDTLSAVTVSARRAGMDDLPPEAAGGQVGSGARLGVLGNTPALDIPFSVTSYTAQTINNLQAQSIGQVVTTLPSVRLSVVPAAAFELLNIRGLDVPSTDFATNGMFGLRLPMEAAERVEVLMGPAAALFGMPPGGSVGGVVNLAPKRAGDSPLMRMTAGLWSDSLLGAHIDAGNRFGADGDIGARINLVHRKGDTALAGGSKEYSAAVLGLDARKERLRASLDIMWNHEYTTPIARRFALAPELSALPFAPENSRSVPNIGWGDSFSRSALLRAEVDLAPTLSAYAGYGKNRLYRAWLGTVPRLLDPAGNYRAVTDLTQMVFDNTTQELGLRGHWQTGQVKHHLVLAWSGFRQDARRGFFNQFPAHDSNLHSGQRPPLPSIAGINNPMRPSADLRLHSIVLADTLGFADDAILLTVGMRRQQLKNIDHTRPPGSGHYDKRANTPLLGLVYKLRQDASLYANYVEGVSRGDSAPVISTITNPGEQMTPYLSKQMEIGGKWNPGQWLTSLSLFQIKRPSAGILGSTFGVFGEQRNRGIELSAIAQTAYGLRILSGANWLDATMLRSPNPLLQGRRAIGVPRWGLNVGLEWDTWWLPGLTVTAGLAQTGPMQVQTNHRMRVPGAQQLDAGLRYATKAAGRDVSVRFHVDNLANRNSWIASTANSMLAGAPREFSVSATVEF